MTNYYRYYYYYYYYYFVDSDLQIDNIRACPN